MTKVVNICIYSKYFKLTPIDFPLSRVNADGETGDEHVSDSVLGGNDIILRVAHKVLHRIMSDYRSSKDMCVTGACHMHDLVVGPHIAHIGLVTITGGENKRRCQQTGR